jgi:CubicO group peptidase (beta-lactamase class C family)
MRRILLLLLLALPCPAQLSPTRQSQLETAISRFMSTHNIPGLSVAVVEDGKYEWSAGFGMADLENSVPATSQTLYRLASVSKPITATAALLLWQQRKLDLDAPVQNYCPSFPKKEVTITTRQLLGHLSGIRFYKSFSQDDPEYGNTRHFAETIQSGFGFFKDDPLLARPGAEFHYSTQGFTVVGCVIQGASGQSYVDYVRDEILRPAGMVHTMPDDVSAIIPFRARFYSKDDSGVIHNAGYLDSSYKIPGGGWLSSAIDIANFEVAILNDRLLQRSTRDLMWTPLKPADGKPDTYALGWDTGTDLGVPDVHHEGRQQGTNTFLLIVPARRAGVVVLMNLEGGGAPDLARELMKIVLDSK